MLDPADYIAQIPLGKLKAIKITIQPRGNPRPNCDLRVRDLRRDLEEPSLLQVHFGNKAIMFAYFIVNSC